MQRILSFILLFFISVPIFSQIILNETAPYTLKDINSGIFHNSSKRKIIDLRTGWKVYEESKTDSKIETTIPCLFKNSNSLIFENEFTLSSEIISNYSMNLHCLGINYNAEIMLNEVVILKKNVANIPVTVELPDNLLSSLSPNLLKIKVDHELNDNSTVPSFQRFLFPDNFGGISRDVFIELLPKSHVAKVNITPVLKDGYNIADIKIEGLIRTPPGSGDSLGSNYSAVVEITNQYNQLQSGKSLTLDVAEMRTGFNTEITIENVRIWSPENPQIYTCHIKLLRDNTVVDHYIKTFSLYDLKVDKDIIRLNGKEFQIRGVSYITPEYTDFNEEPYKKIKEDLSIIKDAGFNTVRFIKSIPHPYALEYCQSVGLLAFIELPVNSVPEQILNDNNYRLRVGEITDLYLDAYKDYSAVAAFGMGSSFLPDDVSTSDFIASISKRIKSGINWLTYASFLGVDNLSNNEIDFTGIEIYSDVPSSIKKNIGSSKLFISEAVYPNYNKSQSGYLNQYSYEAQAKFFENLISLSDKNNINAYFLSTMFNYSGDFTSLYTGFSESGKYSYGILDNEKNLNRISFNLIKSKQTNGKRIAVPIGIKKEDGPLFIIFTGVILAVFMLLLVNSKKKFRQDATRALLRPYNFFADIRDHRIISGFHTILLMIIIAGSHALLLVNLLYFLKNNILVEKILLAFGVKSWLYIFSYLAWNPVTAFIYTFILSILWFFLLALVIKGASFFIKTRVLLTNIYYVIIWAFLPMTILLPVKLILYRLLILETFNIYIYIFLIIYLIWIMGRVLKGVYVIFDVNKSSVYLYSILFLLIIFSGTLIYFQITDSTVYFLFNAFKQYQLM